MSHESFERLAHVASAAAAAAPASADAHALVVDDDPLMRQMITSYLSDYDIRVTALADGSEVIARLEHDSIDLILLDLKLPGEDGMQIARRVRALHDVPILMLTGRKDEADRVMGLEIGADDYLTKPFSPRELLARIRALLRRTRSQESVAEGVAKLRAYRFAGWELNVRLRRLVSPEGKTVPCTKSEFNLLVAFLSDPQRVLSRDDLLDRSRLYNDEVYDRTVDVQVGRLRKKLEAVPPAAPLIRTERGAGYMLTVPVEIVR